MRGGFHIRHAKDIRFKNVITICSKEDFRMPNPFFLRFIDSKSLAFAKPCS